MPTGGKNHGLGNPARPGRIVHHTADYTGPPVDNGQENYRTDLDDKGHPCIETGTHHKEDAGEGERVIKSLLPDGDMLNNAFLTGLISEGEYLLLDNITVNYRIYKHSVDEILGEKGLITDEDEHRLREIRMRIYANALRTAHKDGNANDNAKYIIDTLKEALGLTRQTLEDIETEVKRELRVE